MSRLSSRVVVRKFGDALKAAERGPVLIEHYGRPRAALLSMTQYRMFVEIMRRYARDEAAELLVEAYEAATEGRLKTCGSLLAESRKMSAIGGRFAEE